MPHLTMCRTRELYVSSVRVTMRLSRIMGETIENAFGYLRVRPASAVFALKGERVVSNC